MIDTKTLDTEIEKTQTIIKDMRSKMDVSSEAIEQIAETDTLGDVDFDIENARIQDVLQQQKTMEANIADMIIGLEDITNSFGDEFKNMQEYTVGEKLIGFFSKNKAQSVRNERVRTTSLAGNLQDLLAKSNIIVSILKEQKTVLEERYTTSEASLRKVIDRRKIVTDDLQATQKLIESLNPALMDLENQIGASTDQAARTKLEGERSKLATEYNQAQAREQELLAGSQTLERYTSMFQTFVDSLNNQMAAQSTLINKLNIDTEQRVVLYKSLEDSLKTASQQEVAHKINTLGSKVDTAAEQTMAGIGAAAQSHIADLLELHEKNMVSSQEIQRRKKLADDAFARRFGTVLEQHEASRYVSQ